MNPINKKRFNMSGKRFSTVNRQKKVVELNLKGMFGSLGQCGKFEKMNYL